PRQSISPARPASSSCRAILRGRRTGSICAGPMIAGSRTTGCKTTKAMPRSPSAAPTASTASSSVRAAQFGIVASGKAYADVCEALSLLGIDEAMAASIGLRVLKIGMPWPLDPVRIRDFSEGLREILIVEERREIVENQIKQHLFNWHSDLRPRIVGKFDEKDAPCLPLAH